MIQLTKDQIRVAFGEVLQLNMWPYPPAKRPIDPIDESFLQCLTRNINLLIQQSERNAEQNAERAKE
jgi:hypothetical protein